jgi:soluble lytic murein transglycosylase
MDMKRWLVRRRAFWSIGGAGLLAVSGLWSIYLIDHAAPVASAEAATEERPSPLERYLELPVAPATAREAGEAALRQGLERSRADDLAGALEAFHQAEKHLPQMRDWARMLAAEAGARAGDTAAVLAELAEVDEPLVEEWGWRSEVRARQNASDISGALRAAEAAAQRLDDGPRRAEAYKRVGDLRLAALDTAGARAGYRQAMASSELARAAVDAARTLSSLPGASPEDQLEVGRIYVRHGNIERGIAGLDAFLSSGEGTAAARAEVRLEAARALFAAGRFRDAERRALVLSENSPDPRLGAEATFLAGRAQYRQGRADVARISFLNTASRFPNQTAAAEALFVLADLDHDAGRVSSARRYYERAMAIQPASGDAILAGMRLGGLAYVDGDYRSAASLFDEYRARSGDDRAYQQAAYWAGKAFLELGDTLAAAQRLRWAQAVDPVSYYGMRAVELLGESDAALPLAASPGDDSRLPRHVPNALLRIDLLAKLGLAEAAAYEAERAKQHLADMEGGLYALAEAYAERGDLFSAVRLGREIQRSEGAYNLRLLRILYPFPYQDEIVRQARSRGLDPFLVAGLIRQESLFDAAIVSGAGAVGLMQIMPATGRMLASQEGLGPFDVEGLNSPTVNLQLGTRYLADLLVRYGGNLTETLAAYNAGPSRIVRWRRLPESSNDELFAERIPFTETRDYVRTVQHNARLYALLYPEAAAVVTAE